MLFLEARGYQWQGKLFQGPGYWGHGVVSGATWRIPRRTMLIWGVLWVFWGIFFFAVLILGFSLLLLACKRVVGCLVFFV